MLVIASVSLFVTLTLHNKIMLLGTDYHEITPDGANTHQEQQLYNVVDEMRIAAGLRYMPKVFIINANYMNAFASGYSEKSAMIAITRGLLEKLNRDELQAVMAHELSHIRHLDIKLTLIASLLANMTIITLDIFFRGMIFGRNSRDSRSRNSLLLIIMLLRFLLPIISMLLLFYLSRTRELMADAGCVELTRNNAPLASALIKIQQDYSTHREEYSATLQETPHEQVRREAYLFDPAYAGLNSIASISNLFSTHPSLEERLKALGYNKKN
jgi:heat shock protein HtpX